jgi:hypothetical protein
MTPPSRSVMLVMADPAEWTEHSRVRGTGGWSNARAREALDWATLGRFMGWSVTVGRLTDPASHPRLMDGSTFVVFACDVADVPSATVRHFRQRMEDEPLLLVTRGGVQSGGTPIGESAVITKEPVGRGAILRLAMHPSAARDADRSMTRVLQRALVFEAMRPIAWLDHSGTLVLRMDDPGGAQNVHWRRWYSRKLIEAEWNAIGLEMRRRGGRLSVGYITEWVDDGDPARGELLVDGMKPSRVAGAVHDSSRVVYTDLAGHGPSTLHDYADEFRGIEMLRRAGLAGVELHGCTHMHPDVHAWAVAPDRYESAFWFRELGYEPAGARCAIDRGIAALERQFGTRPTTLICPGDEWTNDVLERALDLDIQLVGSYYLAIRDGDSFWWCTHVCAPYIDEPDGSWFASPLPVVGYCHDRDLVLNGVDWWRDCLERWCAAGARRIIDYRQLASDLSLRLQVDDSGNLRLTDGATSSLPIDTALPVWVRYPNGDVPDSITACAGGRRWPARIDRVSEAVGQVSLPGPPGTPAVRDSGGRR